MLAAARALLNEPRVLMLDEPSAGLSPKLVGQVFDTLRRISDAGVTLVLVEQNVRAALGLTDRALVLVDGRLAHDGPAADLHDGKLLGDLFLGHRAAEAGRMNPQAIIDGLVSGSTIGLGAIGLTLTYSILRFANFTHGDFLAWGAYLNPHRRGCPGRTRGRAGCACLSVQLRLGPAAGDAWRRFADGRSGARARPASCSDV